METMRGIYFDGEKAVYREDLPKPVPGPTQSLVRIHLAGVCNTDKEILKGYRPAFRGVMGHEFVGHVVESSDPDWVGKRVVGELNAGCGHCVYCRTGREKHCDDRRVLGMERKDGCFAEYMTIETHLLHAVPDTLPDERAVFTEPFAAALEIPEQVHIKPSLEAAVIGDGRLSYMVAQVLALCGCGVTVFGHHAEKLKAFAPFAKTALAPAGTFELVVECSGAPGGLADAMALVRHKGTVVLKSTYAGQTQVDMSAFAVHEVTLVGSRCGPFEAALRLLSRGLVDLEPIELHDLKDFSAAFTSPAFKSGFDLR